MKDGRVGIWQGNRVREIQLEGRVKNEKDRWPAVVSLVRGTLTVSVGGRAESSGRGIELRQSERYVGAL